MKEKAIILLSGGIDSSTLLAKITSENYEITAISFLYGQKHTVEVDYAKTNAKKYKVEKHLFLEIPQASFEQSALVNKNINPSLFKNKEDIPKKVNSYVPFRNLIFLSFACSMAEMLGINKIFFAVNLDDSDNYWDCSLDFVSQMNTLSQLNSSIEILTPFIDLSKKDIIKLAKELDVDLSQTISCYHPLESKECGKCLSCIIKKEAMYE